MDLTDYLLYTKSQLNHLDEFSSVVVILGNESFDLDSIVSTCVYGYFLHQICESSNILYLPVINTNQTKFRLRKEIHWLLQDNVKHLIFLPDLNLDHLFREEKLKIILVDHHHLLRTTLNQAVVEIIDHHQVINDAILLNDPSAIRIEMVGSCCTLIAEKLLEAHFQFPMTNDLAYFLSAVILFDTVNFSPEAKKTTEKDQYIYQILQTYRDSSCDDTILYQTLKELSTTIAGETSTKDLLYRDAKQLVRKEFRLVMSSLPMNYSVQKLLETMETIDDLSEFLSENDNSDALIITSIEDKNKITKRQLAIYTKLPQHMSIIDELLNRNELKLGLHEISLPNLSESSLKIFDQANVLGSRKFILPFLEKNIDESLTN